VDQARDAIDLADGVPRKDIDRQKLGVNAFFNERGYGSISAQYAEVSQTLGIKHLRVLAAWNDAVQGDPSGAPNLSFYDAIVQAAPSDVDLLVILTDVPRWMGNPATWIDGNPRTTFVKRWVEPVVARYAANPRVVGFQIWNEPNAPGRFDNSVLELDTNAVNYLELLAQSYSVIKRIAPGKLVVNAATTAINQNYPDTLNYNRTLRDNGLLNFVDVFAIHYYGRQYENVLRSGGVKDFLSSMGNRIWVTESGAQGATRQLKYVEQTWPFLSDRISAIERFYYYQMYETGDPATSYGLRNGSSDQPVSDFYVWLRDGK
jgi:endo-1,4-beta-mannosidase